jgi:hypothetical protein
MALTVFFGKFHVNSSVDAYATVLLKHKIKHQRDGWRKSRQS